MEGSKKNVEMNGREEVWNIISAKDQPSSEAGLSDMPSFFSKESFPKNLERTVYGGRGEKSIMRRIATLMKSFCTVSSRVMPLLLEGLHIMLAYSNIGRTRATYRVLKQRGSLKSTVERIIRPRSRTYTKYVNKAIKEAHLKL